MGQLFSEFRRWNVFRVGAAYAVVGWVFVASNGVFGAIAQSPDVVEERLADLAKLVTIFDVDKSYSAGARAQAEEQVAALRERAAEISQAEFYLGVRRVVAIADNAHTFVLAWPVFEEFGAIPIRIFWFSDGLYIVRAKSKYASLIGARIETIASLPVDQVFETMSEYAGGSVEFARAYATSPLILSPALLAAAGISENPSEVKMGLRLPNGEVVEERLAADPPDTGRLSRLAWQHVVWPNAKPWRYLPQSPVNGEDGEWLTAPRSDGPEPLYLRDEEEVFRFFEDIGGGVAYLQLRQNGNNGEEKIAEFVTMAGERMAGSQPKHLVLDMRFNSGGNLGLTADFMLSAAELLPDDGLVFAITGSATFSAGIYSSFLTKEASPEKTIIVGTYVADRTRFWAESGGNITLPNSGYFVTSARQMHDLGAGCFEEICHLADDPKINIAVEDFMPDLPVGLSYRDFVTNRDPAMEAIFQYIGEQIE